MSNFLGPVPLGEQQSERSALAPSPTAVLTRLTARPEGTHTKIVFAVSTINKLVSHKISTPPVVSHKVSTPALYQIVMYLTFIVFCTRALPCPPLKMRCTHGRLPRRPSPPGQLTATEMTPRPLQNALAQWLPAPAVISARLGAGRLQLVCQD